MPPLSNILSIINLSKRRAIYFRGIHDRESAHCLGRDEAINPGSDFIGNNLFLDGSIFDVAIDHPGTEGIFLRLHILVTLG